MSDDQEMDPEVLADLQLRDRTERERRPSMLNHSTWTPEPDVGAWHCRRCRVLVGVTASAMEHAKVFDDELKRRGRNPMDKSTIMLCPACRELERDDRIRDNAIVRQRIGDDIRQLKLSEYPLTEHALIQSIRALGHPDVEGMLRVLEDKAKALRDKGPRKRL